MLRLISVFLLIGLTLSMYGQNKVDFFKSYPHNNQLQTLPHWAQMMYSEDPNVFSVIDAYAAFYLEHDLVKTIHTQNYKHWIQKVYGLLNAEGKIISLSTDEHAKKIVKIEEKINTGQQDIKSLMTWENIGPFETYFQGSNLPVSWQCNVYAIDQSTTNPDLLICGTEHGGVFKTTNKGGTWSSASANASFCNGVTAVAIDQSNNSVFYAGASGVLYKTANGGGSWSMCLMVGGEIHEIKFDPLNANHIFVMSNEGVHETNDGGDTWTQIFADRAWDLDYHPSDPNMVYLLKENTSLVKQEFFKSTDNGSTWALMTSGWYTPQNANQAKVDGGKIGVSLDSPDRVYAALIGESKAGDDGWIGVYRSDNSGSSWYLPSGQIGSPYSGNCNVGVWNVATYCGSDYHQGMFNFDLEVSPANADLFWVGTIRLSESNDGGESFKSIGGPGAVRLNNIHADIQAIHISDQDIWVASDGGINYSSNNLLTHESKKYGISASSFWGFDMGWNEDVIVGGRYHNGNAVMYQAYGTGNSLQVGGAEEPTGHVHTMDNQRTYFGCCYGNDNGSSNSTSHLLIPSSLGNSVTSYPNIEFRNNEHYIPYATSEFTHHPNYSDHILAGRLAAIYQSTDGGRSWNILHDFGSGYVTEIEYCRSDPNQIYCINRTGNNYYTDSKIYKSTDGGASWIPIARPPTNDAFRFTIASNPLDKNEIWAAAPFGRNGSKIYRSLDGGSTWTNMTSNVLDDEQIFDIEFHGGSNGMIYVLTESKYFYFDPDDNIWIQYNSGLPFNLSDSEIKFTKLFYRDSKIRLGSARGIWEIDFPVFQPPVAEPMTYTDYVNCGQDLVQLDSYSMVDQSSVTWTWEISPAPEYISDTSIRNPQVIFGASGYYDVSLTVVDGNGQSHTKTVQEMIFVDTNCACQPCDGCSSNFHTNGDATLDASNCCVDLAKNTTWSVGSVWHDQMINLNHSFEMNFDLELGDISGGDVDGVALMFQNQGFNALGGPGGELGTNGISNSLAIVFRTYIHDRIEVWVNGAGLSGPDVSGSSYPISGSGTFPVKVKWDAPTNILTIDWNNDGDDIIFNNDIISNYFEGNPNDIIWGFTGATGGLAGTNRVCNIAIDVDESSACQTTFEIGPTDPKFRARRCLFQPAYDGEVRDGEAILIKNVIPKRKYVFSFCEGYSTSNFEALVTIVEYDSESNNIGQTIYENDGCSHEFKIPDVIAYSNVLIIIKDANDCTAQSRGIKNGIPVFKCGIGRD